MIRVFLPAYNEESALPKLVQKFDREFRRLGEPYEIVVLDDGSRDRTLAAAKELSRKHPVTLLQHEINQGLGQAMIDGLEYVAAHSEEPDVVVTMDCDDTHDPRYVEAALNKLREGYDMVILSRYEKGGGEEGLSLLKSFLSRGAGLFLKLFFPIKGVREYSCGYRVFTAASLKKAIRTFGKRFIRLPHKGFVVTPEILIKYRMMGARIAEVPFVLNYDKKIGQSKNRPLRTILGYFWLVLLYFGRRKKKV